MNPIVSVCSELHSLHSGVVIWDTGPSIYLKSGLASAPELSWSKKEWGGDEVTSSVPFLALGLVTLSGPRWLQRESRCDPCGTVSDAEDAVGGDAGMAGEACGSQSIIGESTSVDKGTREEMRTMAM